MVHYRPVVQGHEQKRAQTLHSQLAAQARALVKRMRFEAGQGLQYLTAARHRSGSNLDIAEYDPGDTGQIADNLFDRYTPLEVLLTAPACAVGLCKHRVLLLVHVFVTSAQHIHLDDFVYRSTPSTFRCSGQQRLPCS